MSAANEGQVPGPGVYPDPNTGRPRFWDGRYWGLFADAAETPSEAAD